jgi:hypothetical protein
MSAGAESSGKNGGCFRWGALALGVLALPILIILGALALTAGPRPVEPNNQLGGALGTRVTRRKRISDGIS